VFEPNLPFAKLAKLFRGTVYDETEACKGALFALQHKVLKRVFARGLRSGAQQIRDFPFMP
jgi:hypothetical protein